MFKLGLENRKSADLIRVAIGIRLLFTILQTKLNAFLCPLSAAIQAIPLSRERPCDR